MDSTLLSFQFGLFFVWLIPSACHWSCCAGQSLAFHWVDKSNGTTWYRGGCPKLHTSVYHSCHSNFLLGRNLQSYHGHTTLGFVTIFLSNAVISGFISGAAIIIGLSQVKYIFGVKSSGNVVQEILKTLFDDINKFNWKTFLMGTSSIAFLMGLKHAAKVFPKQKWLRAVGPITITVITISITWEPTSHRRVFQSLALSQRVSLPLREAFGHLLKIWVECLQWRCRSRLLVSWSRLLLQRSGCGTQIRDRCVAGADWIRYGEFRWCHVPSISSDRILQPICSQ